MRSEEFWNQFNRDFRPRLRLRAENFAKIFEYLDQFDRPVGTLETGCVRGNNIGSDGSSTILFDLYAAHHPGSQVITVDIDAKATALCRSLVSDRVQIHTGDSVQFLKSLADASPTVLPHLDLLYLDSYDLNLEDVFPSAFHHIMELLAVMPLVGPQTLVVVDDSPPIMSVYVLAENNLIRATPVEVGGKGKFLAKYAMQIGARPYFTGYQCGWIGLRS